MLTVHQAHTALDLDFRSQNNRGSLLPASLSCKFWRKYVKALDEVKESLSESDRLSI